MHTIYAPCLDPSAHAVKRRPSPAEICFGEVSSYVDHQSLMDMDGEILVLRPGREGGEDFARQSGSRAARQALRRVAANLTQ
jgi:hypothetical protein